jgi:hypothetical protein
LHPRFKYLCPVECGEYGFNTQRRDYCDSCQMKGKEDFFRERVIEAWREKLGFDSRRFAFKEMLDLLYQIRSFEDTPKHKISVKLSIILGAYLTERNYYEAKKDFRPEGST